MAAIQETIELKDSFSPIITNIVNSVNYAVSAMEQLRGAIKGRIDDSALKAARESVDGLNSCMRQAEEAAKAANKSMKQTEDAARNASGSFSDAASSFGDLLVAFGGYKVLDRVKDAFAASAGAAIEFESAITGVYKTVDGSGEQLAKISSDIRQMSTEIPATTTEIAGVAEAAGQLGIATNDITDFTKVMINLGESTNLSADEAASSLAKFANITGMSAENYENLGSSVVALGNNFATTETDIVSMATKMASAGELAGLSEADILGLSTAVSSVGIEAEAGGTAISKLLTDIQTAVETGNDSLEDFASVAGMSVEQFSTLFETRAVDALTAFISGLNDVERNGRSATVILDDMEINEVRLSNTIKSLANNSDGMTNAIDMASTAWEQNSALAKEVGTRYATLESKMQVTKNAANDLKIAVGDALTPALGGLSDIAKSVLEDLTGFAKKCPALTAGIAAMAGTFWTLSKAALAVKTLKTAVDMLGISLKGLGKASLVGLGISAGVGVIAAAASHFKKAKNDVEDYNGTMEQCRQEINEIQAKYDAVVSAYGAQNEAADKLSGQLDTLNAQYQKGGGAAADYAQRLADSQKRLSSLTTEYDNKMEAIDSSWQNGMVAVAQLESISSKAQITNSDLDIMSKYANYLNDTFNCNIEVDYDTKSLTGFDPNDINSVMEKVAKDNRKQAAFDSVSSEDFINGYIDEVENLNKIKDEYAHVRDEILKTMNDPSASNDTGFSLKEADEKFTDMIEKSEKILDGYKDQVVDAYNIMEVPDQVPGYMKFLDDMANGFKNVVESAGKVKEELTIDDAAANIWNNHEKEIKELAEAYDEAYTSIRGSLDGMFGMFEAAEMNMEAQEAASYENLEKSLQSQLDYFNQWEEAAKKLSELGLNQNIIDQSTPEQVVGLADSLDRLKESAGDSAVADELEKINSQAKELSEKKDSLSDVLADYKVGLTTGLEDIKTQIENDMKEAVGKLDVSSESAQIGSDIMIAMARAVAAEGASVIDAAQEVKIRVQSILSSISADVSVNAHVAAYGPLPLSATKYAAHANGTTNAEDIFIAGENGPELIVGKPGSTVFPTSETNRIIAAIGGINSADTGIATAMTVNNSFFNTVNNTVSSEINNAKNYDDSSLKSIVDLSLLDRAVNNYRAENISNFDYSRRLENVINYGDSIRNAETAYNSDYSRQLQNSVNYGDSIRSSDLIYSPDYSRESNPITNYSNNYNRILMAENSGENPFEESKNQSESNEKIITIKLYVNGVATTLGSTNEAEIVEVMLDNLKPVLSQILSQEAFEEGDDSYDY